MITSQSNARVREAAMLAQKGKERRKQGLFVVEGPRMAAEIPDELCQSVFVSESFLAQHPEGDVWRDAVEKKGYEAVSDEVMRYMSDTQNPQGVFCVVKQLSWTLEEVLHPAGEGPALLMILESLQDPGNLGTILRAGEGAGVTGVIMNDETADIYNPKVIRSTMGSVLRVPFIRVSDLAGTLSEAKKAGVRLYAAHLAGKNNYEDEDYHGPAGFLIGNEAAGLTDETAALADALVKIPMAGKVESLNAAVAASVLMFEAARQRRKHAR